MDKHDSEEEERAQGAGSQHLSRILHRLRDTTSGNSRPAAEDAGEVGSEESIGRYSNLGEIARGGMGIIYKVQDEEMRRTLAMKVLKGTVLDASGAVSTGSSQRTSRFLEEAQVTGQLEHPGIIPVHEMGLDGSGRLFFTMRLVKGSTLGEVIDLSRSKADEGHAHWTRTRVLGVILKVCEAMAFSHSKQVIHRDLKPANIMVGRFGETYVMDWGLAKVLGTQEPTQQREKRTVDASMLSMLSTTRAEDSSYGHESTHSTLEGDILGTPAYMPPEQARGQLEEMGPASDIYSVGAMLYHLLAGRAPFTSAAGKDGPIEILNRVLEGPPEPLESIARDVPAELVAICQRAMEPVPTERYATMLDLAEDLHAFMEQRVVKAYETGSVAEFRKWVGRNKGMAATAAAAIIVAIAGLAAVSYTQREGRLELAQNNVALAETNAALADSNEDLANANSALESARNLARDNEALAQEQREEALWQSYRANVNAAAILLDQGSAGEARKRLANCDESQRGWEWQFLKKLAGSSLRVLEGHEEYVTCVAYGPDGDVLASGGSGPRRTDNSIRLWDTQTGEELLRITGHTGDLTGIAFSSNGSELVTCSISAQETILWSVDTGEEVTRCEAFGMLAYHPDGSRIAIGGVQGPQISFWDIYEERVTTMRLPGTGGVNQLRFSEDGTLLAVGFTDFMACVIDVEARRVVNRLDILGGKPRPAMAPEMGNGVLAVDFNPRNGQLLTGSSDGSLYAWDLATERITVSFKGHSTGVRSARFHPDGPWVISTDIYSPVRFWNSESGASLELLHGHENWTLASALSPLGDQIASCSLDGTVRLWDGQPGSNVKTYLGEGDRSLRLLAFSRDSKRIAWTPSPDRVRICAVHSASELLALPLFEERIQSLTFDSSGEILRTVDAGGLARAWDSTTGELLQSSPKHGPTSAAAFDGHDRYFAMAATEEQPEIRIFDSTTLQELRHWRLPTEVLAGANARVPYVVQMQFSGDGQTLAIMTALQTVSVWDVAAGELLHYIRNDAGLSDFVFDASNDEIVALDLYAGTSLKTYDLLTGEILRELGGHGILTSLSNFSPDGSRIAVGAADGTVSLWHPERGEMTTLSGTGRTSGGLMNAVGGVEFSPDGKYIANLSWNGTCRIWGVAALHSQADERLAAARRRVHARKAEALVDELLAEFILVSEVVAAITRDETLKSDFRDAAIAIARMRADEPQRLNRASLEIALESDRRPVEYVRALAAAELAVRLHPEVLQYSIALGAAHYRMGNYEQAAGPLDATMSLRFIPGVTLPPIQYAFQAMLHQRMDDPAGAQESLRRAEQSVIGFERAGGSGDNLRALKSLLQEARGVVSD